MRTIKHNDQLWVADRELTKAIRLADSTLRFWGLSVHRNGDGCPSNEISVDYLFARNGNIGDCVRYVPRRAIMSARSENATCDKIYKGIIANAADLVSSNYSTCTYGAVI